MRSMWRGGAGILAGVVLLTGCGLFDPGASTVIEDGCPRGGDGTTVIDYVPFVKRGDRTYLEVDVPPDEPQLQPAQLGAQVGATQCRIADTVNDPNYRSRDGDAAFLEPDTPLFAIQGVDPAFRVAAKASEGLKMFDVDTVPDAQRGADLFGDMLDDVTGIAVNSAVDGQTTLGRITDPPQVSQLVATALNAPVDAGAQPDANSVRYFIEFELADLPPVETVLFVDDGLLDRGIQVPDDFVSAITTAAQHG